VRRRRLTPPSQGPTPWWLEEARAFFDDRPSAPLTASIDVDVAIVGGGYTGLWTALALRERDPSASVALLEARRVGEGPSGRNGGFLHGYWSSLSTLRAVLGDGPALQLAHASSDVIPSVRDFCATAGTDVWLREGGLLRVSAGPEEDAGVERALAAAAELGVEEEAVPLDAAALSARVDSPRFRCGVYFRDGATVQPARLALLLKRAAIERGVRVFEGSPVIAVAAGRLETPEGSVRAREIVLALNAWGTRWPLGGRQTNFGSAVVLTEPAPDLLEQVGWTGGEAVVDGRMFLHYFRTTPDGRVLMGSGSGRLGYGDRVDAGLLHDRPAQARAAAGLRELLPPFAAVPIAASWSGPIDVSVDKLPRFGTVAGTRIHYGAGYSGNGVGPSWLGGQILASLALGADDRWTALPLVHRRARRLPPEPFRYAGGKVVRWGTLAAEEALAAGRRPSRAARAAAAIPRLLRLPIGVR
jgi:glycine/D-amino acid oxidase-like deaminating enzyme